MIKKFLILTIFQLTCLFVSSQDLIEVALHDKSIIIREMPFYYDYDLNQNYDDLSKVLLGELRVFNEKIDSIDVENLIELLQVKPVKENIPWTSSELGNNIIIVDSSNQINLKHHLNFLASLERKQKKDLKRKIRRFNNKRNEWRNYPVSMSRPIYSENKDYALISISLGNNGGNVSFFKKINDKWEFLAKVVRFAY